MCRYLEAKRLERLCMVYLRPNITRYKWTFTYEWPKIIQHEASKNDQNREVSKVRFKSLVNHLKELYFTKITSPVIQRKNMQQYEFQQQ